MSYLSFWEYVSSGTNVLLNLVWYSDIGSSCLVDIVDHSATLKSPLNEGNRG